MVVVVVVTQVPVSIRHCLGCRHLRSTLPIVTLLEVIMPQMALLMRLRLALAPNHAAVAVAVAVAVAAAVQVVVPW